MVSLSELFYDTNSVTVKSINSGQICTYFKKCVQAIWTHVYFTHLSNKDESRLDGTPVGIKS